MAQIAERNLNTMSTNILHSAIGLGDTVICISYYALSFFSHTSHSLSQYLPSFGWPFASDAGRKFAYTNKHTNMKESVCDTKGIRQNKKLVLKRGATSAAWTWFGNEKSSTDQKKRTLQIILLTPQQTLLHLHKNHVRQYRESSRRATQTPGSDVARGTPYSKEPQRWLTASVAMYIFPFYINYLRCSYLHKTIFINLIYRKCIVIWIWNHFRI